MHKLNLLFLAGVFAATLTAQGNDVIVRKNGSRLRGLEITEFAHTGLKATRKGGETVEIPGHLVLSVQWGSLPEEFVAGRAAMNRADYATATQMFGEAANKAARPLVKADCEFFQIQAAVAGIGADTGAAQTAAEKAKAWLAANASHWRVPEAMLLAGRAARLARDFATAGATLRDLDDRASRDGFGPVWSARAKFELALALEGEGKAAEARTTFQAAGTAADNAMMSPSDDDAELGRIKILAKIGEGESYLSEKDYSRAENYFRSMSNSKEPGIAAAALAGQGEAVYLANEQSRDTARLRDAQLLLARASVHDSASGAASGKANYYLGQCLLALGDAGEGDDYKVRARAYFQIVVANYADTRWAAKAKAALAQ